MFLILIIILACVLRFYMLTTIPIGFGDDEAAFGYNAYSLLKTGHDEWGKYFPFPVFESFGDWKLALYLYLVAISQFFLGVTVFATRFPSAAIGVLAVVATYLLTKELFDKKIALVASLLITISPWHIAASRNAYESDLLIFTITLGTYFFLKGLKKKYYITLSFLIFGLSFYLYRSAWTFIPIFILFLVFLYWDSFKNLRLFLAKNIFFFLILLLPLIPTLITFRGQSRFFQESFMSGIQNIGISNDVNERRGDCAQFFGNLFCKLTYNKYNFYLSKYIDNYIANISPQTYYQNINPTGYQSFTPRGYFYTFEFLLAIPGLIYLINIKKNSTKILFVWIVAVLLAPSLTSVGNPGRLNIIMPVPQIIAAIGLIYLIQMIKNNKLRLPFIILATTVVTLSFIRFVADTMSYYPKYAAMYQRYGYGELFKYVESQKSNYSQIIVSRKSDDAKQYIHYLFFTKYDPSNYQKNAFFSRDKLGFRSVDQIDNIKFSSSVPPLNTIPIGTMIVSGNNELSSKDLRPLKTIVDPKGDVLFNVYELTAHAYEE